MGFIAGFLSGVAIMMIIMLTTDNTVDYKESQLNDAYKVCEIANSEPISFNVRTVKCKNGAKMRFNVLNGGDK